MDADHLEKLKSKARERYQAKTEAAKVEYRIAIEAIEQVRRLEKLDDPSATVATMGSRTRKSGLLADVRSAIREIEGSITSERVVEHLRQQGKALIRASVASALRRMAEDPNSDIRTVVAPAGRRAGTYEKKSDKDAGGMKIAAV